MNLLQIGFYEIPRTADEWGKLFYSFPVHIRLLMGLIVIFCMIITILFAVIIGSRIFKTNRMILQRKLQNKYQPILTQLLFEDDTRLLSDEFYGLFAKKDLKNTHRRMVIMEELIHLHENFTGETAIRLELIYHKLNFHRDSMRKLRSRKWYIVAKGLRELALMNLQESAEFIIPFINNKNELLRMEARIALAKLNENDPLAFLAKEKEVLSAWDMANLHAMLSKLPESRIPFFATWLNASNKSVVLFCISMIGAFRQTDALPVLLRLLDQPDEPIKRATIRALREMNALIAEEKLVAMFPLETNEIRSEILKSLESFSSENSIPLYEHILREPVPELDHALHSVKGLLLLGDKGKAVLSELLLLPNDRLQLIISHASDPRL